MLARSSTELTPLLAVRTLRRQEQALNGVIEFHRARMQAGRVRELVTVTWPPLRWLNRVLHGLRRLLGIPWLLSRERPLDGAERRALGQYLEMLVAEVSSTKVQLDLAIARARKRVAVHAPLADTTAGTLYPDDWPAISLEYRRRIGFVCEECGRFAPDGHVHHIIAVAQGGSSDPRNLIFLCQVCHAAKHPHMTGAR